MNKLMAILMALMVIAVGTMVIVIALAGVYALAMWIV